MNCGVSTSPGPAVAHQSAVLGGTYPGESGPGTYRQKPSNLPGQVRTSSLCSVLSVEMLGWRNRDQGAEPILGKWGEKVEREGGMAM